MLLPYSRMAINRVQGNYRPIGLTSQICKVIESILRDNIVSHLNMHVLLLKSLHSLLMLGLHYVPGDHGSMKRSSPWCFGHFYLPVQVLSSLVKFCHGLSRYPWRTVGC